MTSVAAPEFSYDPFDPAVMADPLPYYRVLRDQHPMYYVPQWDLYALSRFDDIWDVLAVSDGTFVASEGTLPAANVLAHHNGGPVPDPPLHPLPFHAVFDKPIYDDIRRLQSPAFRPRSVVDWQGRVRELANQRLDELLPQGQFDLTCDYGGVVVAQVVCELLGIPVECAAEVLAAVNAGSLAQAGSGVDTAAARPNYLQYLIPAVQRRRAEQGPGELPIVDGMLAYRLPDGSDLDDVEAATALHLHRRHRDRAQDRRARVVGTVSASGSTSRGTGRSAPHGAAGTRGDDPLLRTGAMVRAHRPQTVHAARHDC